MVQVKTKRVLMIKTVRPVFRDIFAGASSSVLSTAYCLSYAALIFSGPLTPYLSYGLAATFLSAAVAAAIVALRSSVPFAIAGPDTSTSAVTASLTASLAASLVAHGREDLLGPVMVILALSAVATGVFLLVLGMTRAGRVIRFVPFPVFGGFLGASGVLMLMGAFALVTGRHLTAANIDALVNPALLIRLAPAVAVGLLLRALTTRFESALVLPAVILGAVAVTLVTLHLMGVSLESARASGWLFGHQTAARIASPWRLRSLLDFPWRSLPWLSGELVAVMFVTATSLLLNTTGIEIATGREAVIEQELKALGLASLASAALGGFVSCLSLSRTQLNHQSGARGRLSGLTLAAISAMLLVVNPAFLSFVPKFALAGLLIQTGGQLCASWLAGSARKLTLLDYLALLVIAAIIIMWGFIAGVFVGIVIGCSTFALNASRVNAIKYSFDGVEVRSSLDRAPDEAALLDLHGHEIQGACLQSYVFFGTANRLYEHVKSVLACQPECRFLIFDFRLVTGIDSSATHSFGQIRAAAAKQGAELVLVNLNRDMERAFHVAQFLTEDLVILPRLDDALERCEEAVLKAHRGEAIGEESLHALLEDALGDRESAERLASHCRRRDAGAGEIIAQQGEPPSCMQFVVHGRVGVYVDMGDGHVVRVRSLAQRTTVGEMGLITGQPRSATVKAESPTILYELPAEAYARIQREDPALGQTLLSYVATVLAQRLSFANRAVGVLQR
jgi:SulP family sulfate permease